MAEDNQYIEKLTFYKKIFLWFIYEFRCSYALFHRICVSRKLRLGVTLVLVSLIFFYSMLIGDCDIIKITMASAGTPPGTYHLVSEPSEREWPY